MPHRATTFAALGTLGLLVVAQTIGLLPPCPIHAATGILCPGCGGTRCLLALLHGQLSAAWQHNALLTLLLPLGATLGAAHLVARARRLRSPATALVRSRPFVWSLAAGTLLFDIGRNLP